MNLLLSYSNNTYNTNSSTSDLFSKEDIKKIYVYSQCTNSYPCEHDCKITLNDNSILEKTLTNKQIARYINNFPEKIDGSNLSHFND